MLFEVDLHRETRQMPYPALPQPRSFVPGGFVRAWLTGLLGVLLRWDILQAAAPSAPIPAPGTLQMADLLQRIARQTTPVQNPFLSREQAELVRRQLATNQNPAQQIPLEFALGTRLLQSGDNEEALAVLDQVERRIHATGMPVNTTNFLNLRLNQALAHLRQGELRNCLTNPHSQSCLLPIEGHGRHVWQDGSRAALGILTNTLEQFPDSLAARWLLNVAAMTVGDYPDRIPDRWRIPPSAFASEAEVERMVNVAGPAGLALNGLAGGVVVEDLDGDGLLDIVSSSIGFHDPLRFLHNNGDGTFSDRSREAGFTGLTEGLNILATDYNNDGHVDLHVLRGGWAREGGRLPDSLLKNRGDGTFEDVTAAAGLLSFHPGQTATWFDFDGDGWLDVFVGNETVAGESRHSCELFRNNRNGTFTEVALDARVRVNTFVKGVTSGDYNNDGRPDLYVSIQGRPNQLFRNDGPAPASAGTNAWKFTEVAAAAGVQEPLYSFPTWFFDYDNDGHEDLFVAGYRINDVGDVAADYLGLPSNGQRAKLFHNRGDGTFEDVSEKAGLNRVLHAMGSNYGDLDNDGWLDLYLGTGDPDYLTVIPNRMFRNAEGKRFQDVTTSAGLGHLQKGHAVSFADVDNDGDQDLYLDLGGAYQGDLAPNALFANPGSGGSWVKLQLVGTKANRPGIGARLTLTVSGPSGERVIRRTVGTGGSFGDNPLRQEIGLGDARSIRSLEIRWPGSGTVQTIRDLEPNHLYRVTEGNAQPELIPLRSFVLPLPAAHVETATSTPTAPPADRRSP